MSTADHVEAPSRAHRLAHIVGAVLVAVVLPALVMAALVGELGVAAMGVGLLLGATGCKLGGTRRMLFVAPLLGVAAGLGASTAYDWWWVALLACAGVIAGAGIGFGWFGPLLMVPFAATFVTPVSTAKDAMIYGVIVAIAALYGVVIMRRFGTPEVVDGPHLALPVATVVAVVFGLVLGGAAAIGVALGWTEPYWVPEPILILILYIIMGKRDRIKGKAIGTALGVAAAIPVALLDPVPRYSRPSESSPSSSRSRRRRRTGSCTAFTRSRSSSCSPPRSSRLRGRGTRLPDPRRRRPLVVGLFVIHALGSWLAKHDPQPEIA